MKIVSFFRKVLDQIAPEMYAFDPLNLHPDTVHAIQYCDNRQWEALSRLFENKDHYHKHLLTEAICELVKDDHFFDDWCDVERSNYLPFLLRGSQLLRRAWVYRGYGRGEEITDDRAILFFETLELSLASLTEAMNLNPQCCEAPARSIRTLMGLSADWEDIDQAYARLSQTNSVNFSGEMNYLMASCEKWLGSHDKMFAFARATMEKKNHPSIAGLIAAAHHEMYFYLDRFDDSADAEQYFQNTSVQAEIDQASRYLLDGTADRPLAETAEAHGYFALVYSLAEHFEGAAAHFQCMGKIIAHHPWEFYDTEFLNHSRRKSLAYL